MNLEECDDTLRYISPIHLDFFVDLKPTVQVAVCSSQQAVQLPLPRTLSLRNAHRGTREGLCGPSLHSEGRLACALGGLASHCTLRVGSPFPSWVEGLGIGEQLPLHSGRQ